MARVTPGFAFSLVCDLGFAVGLVTHQVPRRGDLVWIAEPVFDEEPDASDVAGIERWRWPVFFPTGPAVRRRLVSPIGVVEIPPALQAMPRLRGGNKQMGWREVAYVDGDEQVLGVAEDSTVAISQIVNDTMLKELIVTHWTPERAW